MASDRWQAMATTATGGKRWQPGRWQSSSSSSPVDDGNPVDFERWQRQSRTKATKWERAGYDGMGEDVWSGKPPVAIVPNFICKKYAIKNWELFGCH
jgi:hypothetical protein